MKIELSDSTNPTDALNKAMALMSYHEYLIGEISEGAFAEDSDDRFGHIILIQLQKALINAAIAQQDALDATELKAAIVSKAAAEIKRKNLDRYFNMDTSDEDRSQLEGLITVEQIEKECREKRDSLSRLETVVSEFNSKAEFAEALLEKKRQAA